MTELEDALQAAEVLRDEVKRLRAALEKIVAGKSVLDAQTIARIALMD